MPQKQYACIDLKSFYASVECVERGLDPLFANLVVADLSRTEKTICLAVTPPLKAHGISGRARLFEVIARLKEVNAERRSRAPGKQLSGSSFDDRALRADAALAVDYIAAPPRMALYMDYSTRIYQIYLKYVAPEDIHVYSVDEVFIDLTPYLPVSRLSAREFVSRMIRDVLATTGITAAAGIGTNLYLAKVAMDITAKHVPADENGVRIAELDELSYRRQLWEHRPLTDFWRVGPGYSSRLEGHGLYTMGDVARCSLTEAGEDFLYRLFGVNAELLIDHAWGYEPCTIAQIKAYRPATSSLGSGQVLTCPYTATSARLVLREMTDSLVLELVDKGLLSPQFVITVGYDIENLKNGRHYSGQVVTDHYGRKIPKHAHGTANLPYPTSSTRAVTEAVMALYDRIVDKTLLIRRLNITACHLIREGNFCRTLPPRQLDLFSDAEEEARRLEEEDQADRREKNMQKAILELRKKYGKNTVLKGMNLQKDATARDRNRQIGGHKA